MEHDPLEERAACGSSEYWSSATMLPSLRVIRAVTAATMPGLVGSVDDQARVIAQRLVVDSHDSGSLSVWAAANSRAHSDVASSPPNV